MRECTIGLPLFLLMQVPSEKSAEALERDLVEKVGAKCAGCRCSWGTYRGKFTCTGKEVNHGNGLGQACNVPIMLCPGCEASPTIVASAVCELCREGYVAPSAKALDFAKLKEAKRKAAELEAASGSSGGGGGDGDDHGLRGGGPDDEGEGKAARKARKKAKKEAKLEAAAAAAAAVAADGGGAAAAADPGACRLFVGKLPLTVDAASVKRCLGEAAADSPGNPAPLGAVAAVHWITDKASGAFYGSCFVQMASPKLAARVAARFAKDDKAPGGGGAAPVASKGGKGGKDGKGGKQAAAGGGRRTRWRGASSG